MSENSSEISKIELPNGDVYDIKDETSRESITEIQSCIEWAQIPEPNENNNAEN